MLNKYFKYTLIALAVFLLTAAILLILSSFRENKLKDDLGAIIQTSAYSSPIQLIDFTVYKQADAWSCGPTTIKMVVSYINKQGNYKLSFDEAQFADRKSGMLPKVFEKYLLQSLKGYSVELKENLPDSMLIESMYAQLKSGLPVPIYFSTVNEWDKPNYDTHYSAVVGLDLTKKEVTIANAYGFTEKVSLPDFLDSLKYRNFNNQSLIFRLGVIIGVIGKNNIFLIHKNA